MDFVIGNRVRVRPDTDTAEVIDGFSATGTVEAIVPVINRLTVRLDSGELVEGTPAAEWEMLP